LRHAVILLALAALVATAHAQAITGYYVVAPFGYIVHLSAPVHARYAHANGAWRPLVVNGTVFIAPALPDALDVNGRRVPIVLVPGRECRPLAVDYGGRLVVSTCGERLYASRELLCRGLCNGTRVLVNEFAEGGGIVLVSKRMVEVRTRGGYSIADVADVLGVPRYCIVSAPSPWRMGILYTPPCTATVVRVYRVVGSPPVIVAARFATRLGVFDVSFNPSLVDALVETRHIQPVETPGYVHVAVLPRGVHVYDAMLRPIPVVRAEPAVAGGVCSPPPGARLVYNVSFGARGLAPGDVLVYEAGGAYYACIGPMGWLYARAYSVSGGGFAELPAPYTVEGVGGPVLVVSSTGWLGYGGRVVVPPSVWGSSTVWVVTGGGVGVLPEPPHVYQSPAFAVGVAAAALGVAFYAFRLASRGVGGDELELVWDVEAPEPPRPVSDPGDAAARYTHAWGRCPDDIDLALQGVLVDRPGRFCPWRVEPGVEDLLASIARLAVAGFWGVRRPGPRDLLIYTYTDSGPVYIHVHAATERDPREALKAALRAAAAHRVPGARPLAVIVAWVGVPPGGAPREARLREALVYAGLPPTHPLPAETPVYTCAGRGCLRVTVYAGTSP
jgi:hypothetical protein